MELILASQSRYRRALLEQMGWPFRAIASNIDENLPAAISAEQMAASLAEKKAAAVFTQWPDTIVVGSDQIAEVDGEILTKPGSREKNIKQLQRLSGGEHRLWTAVCVLFQDQKKTAINCTRLKLRKLGQKEIEAYVNLDQPMDCAGGYKIEKAGIKLMRTIETQDFTAIQGLPMIALTEILIELGFAVF